MFAQRSVILPAAALSLLTGCSPLEPLAPDAAPIVCSAGQEPFEGRCVDPAARYEPDARIDVDNVVAYGDPPSRLSLPEPPKSGFRIIAPARALGPGEEIDTCVSWPYPEIQNRVIYSARIYTTTGLHHSNLIAKPVNAEAGLNPYPDCHPGASDPFVDLPEVIPDVLFGNSTQLVGEETLTFPVGMGYVVDTTREMATNIHYLNSSTEPQVVEVAYDFYTMPLEKLEGEVAAFVLQVNDFLIPPHTTGVVGASCDVFGGSVVSMLPHTHKLAEEFVVDLLPYEGEPLPVFREGGYDLESDIHTFDPMLDLTEIDKIRYECTFNNTTDHDVVYGIGENEMCVLFGYVYPARKQFVAYSETVEDPCTSIQIGLFRPE
jgi:Copper type II ascorbate-dependent monooxygenase, C-terminal domain